jgi:hypothetical protein
MISIKLNCTKLDKNRLFKGKQGTYADLILMENKDGRDQYGFDGFVKQSVTKEEREAGVKGPIVGNWKHLGQGAANSPARASGRPVGASGRSAGTIAPEDVPSAANGDSGDPIPF